ncbi:hypothetical protein PUN4_830029 [Paraburkholderia unamae]|nr:uncharacterized protein DUF3717 [Paraburkholderia unamae]CAG9273964.1 hypothetical protein PUN4_830029 [Paraburkholderia unamae]
MGLAFRHAVREASLAGLIEAQRLSGAACDSCTITIHMSDISITELEAAINFWRNRSPSSGDELALCQEASALSKPYALLIVQRQNTISPERLDPIARAAWESYVSIKNSLQS